MPAMGDRVDYRTAARVYEQGRALPQADLEHWHEAVGRFVPPVLETVLDLGAGTGIFARAWSTWGAHLVAACEPSGPMRVEAHRSAYLKTCISAPAAPKRSHSGTPLLRSCGYQPSCTTFLMSTRQQRKSTEFWYQAVGCSSATSLLTWVQLHGLRSYRELTGPATSSRP